MVYKLLRINEIGSNFYIEFFPGKLKDKYWNDNSVYIYHESIYVINDLLKKSNTDYSFCGVTYYDKNNLEILKDELLKRLKGMKEDNNYKIVGDDYKEEVRENVNKILEKNKIEIIKMLEELISWLYSINIDEITIIGI